jgi:hypothetical protein
MNGMQLNKETHDISVTDGQISRVTASDEIAQRIKTRILLVQQEWFLNLEAGLPWFTELTGKNVDLYKVRSYISLLINQTEGVDQLVSLDLDVDQSSRKLNIEFKYIDIYGNTISGDL